MVIEDGRVYAHAHPSNAFASWLEPWYDAARTCMSINHMRMAEHGPVLQVGGPAAWLQVVHGGNVSNKVRGRRVGPEAVRDRFPPEVPGRLRASSATGIALENLPLTRCARRATSRWRGGAGRAPPPAPPGRGADAGGAAREGYVPEIDGLRTVAVLSLLFDHVGWPLPGGYVGVDVFFVISGYLITGMIRDEVAATGGSSSSASTCGGSAGCFRRFWSRSRSRRRLGAAAFA